MNDRGYETAHLDELEALPVDQEGLTWRPVRRRFGIGAFGANAYTAAEAGQRVVEEHYERGGHEELYVVLRGRATFTLDEEEVEAPAGTLVYVRSGTKRGAVASEPGTAVLAVGAKPGEVFEPSGWETTFAALGYQRAGQEDKGRAVLEAAAAEKPDTWQLFYNFACFEAIAGRPDEALRHLRRAAELEPDEVRTWAAEDSDFDALRDDPRFESALAGKADAARSGERS